MIKNALKGVAFLLLVVMLTLLGAYLSRTDPYGPIPGRRLPGEEVTETITDWSFVKEHRTLTSEVRPADPYSVNTSYVFHQGAIYISSGRGGESRWPRFLLANPEMRLRIGEKLYPVRATRVTDPDLIRQIHDTRDGGNPNRPPRTEEERARVWFFRIDSR